MLSEQPVCRNNILTMKTKIVMPPPAELLRADVFSRRSWRCIQQIGCYFWQGWRKKFFSILQPCQKWIKNRRGFVIADIVLLMKAPSHNKWRMTTVMQEHKNTENAIRKVWSLTGKSWHGQYEQILKRPVQKLVLLKKAEVRFPDENCHGVY